MYIKWKDLLTHTYYFPSCPYRRQPIGQKILQKFAAAIHQLVAYNDHLAI